MLTYFVAEIQFNGWCFWYLLVLSNFVLTNFQNASALTVSRFVDAL